MPNLHEASRLCLNSTTNHVKKDQEELGTNTLTDFYESLHKDSQAALVLSQVLKTQDINKFITIIKDCHGTLMTSGVGKSGSVAERMSKSLSSTGTPAYYVHGGEWTHGDLGKGHRGDVVIFLSHSGKTCECVLAAKHLRQRDVRILSIVGQPGSQLEGISDACIVYKLLHDLEEPIGGVPTTSVVLQEMIVNAVVCQMVRIRRYTKIEFSRNHPGGALGITLCDT